MTVAFIYLILLCGIPDHAAKASNLKFMPTLGPSAICLEDIKHNLQDSCTSWLVEFRKHYTVKGMHNCVNGRAKIR